MPKKHPPHLPPQECNVESHRSWQRIKIILAAAGFGLLAGVTGAAIMLGWIWPGYGGGDVWAVSQNLSFSDKSQLDEKINQEIRDRIFGIYENSVSQSQGSYTLRPQDKLGDAVVISSDGWLAMYQPAPAGNYKNWKAVSFDGSVYAVERIMPDRYSGMLYFKLAVRDAGDQNDAQFKVITFDDNINFGEETFVLKNINWYRNAVSFPAATRNPFPHLDTAPSYFYSLDTPAGESSIVINNQGRLAGFVNQNGDLLPNIYITRIIPTLLSNNRVAYLSLGVEGLFNREQAIVVNGERQRGFIITKVLAKNSLLKKGDIILDINGREIEQDNILWYNKDATIRISVWRAGKVMEVESKIVEIN